MRCAEKLVVATLCLLMAPSLAEAQGTLRIAAKDAKPDGRLFFVMGNIRDPLVLKEIVFQTGETRSVKDGKVLNNAPAAVVSYQLGFAVVDRVTRHVTIVPGPVINSTIPINPKEERGVPSILLKDFFDQVNFVAVGVFVRKTNFADGTVWNADASRIKAEIENGASGGAGGSSAGTM